jgi:hypothetical protein
MSCLDAHADTDTTQEMEQAPMADVGRTRLAGRWLMLAHLGWGFIVLFDMVSFVPGALLYDPLVHIPCSDAQWETGMCVTGQLSPSAIQQLSHLGVSLDLYAALALAVVLITSAVFITSGFLIAWRRWRDGMGLFVSLVLLTFAAGGFSNTLTNAESALLPAVNPTLASILSPFGFVLSVAIWPALGAFLLTFPIGRFTPQWSWLLVGLWITNYLAFTLQSQAVITYLSVAITFSSVIAVQVYRYRHVYTPIECQQTKWLVFTVGAAILFIVMLSLFEATIPGLGGYDSLFYFIADLVIASFFFLLVAMYAVGVVGTQALVTRVVGPSAQQEPILLVATTLLIAALLQRLRRRLQASIDRRFYRKKYDAARTLAAFADTLREEVDLPELADRLLGAVEETMQPAHVSLWLRQPERQGESRPGAGGAA